MALSEDKIKFSVYLSQKMHDDILAIADEMGISRQDYIRYCVAQMNLAYKKSLDGIDAYVQKISEKENK